MAKLKCTELETNKIISDFDHLGVKAPAEEWKTTNH